MPSLPPGPRAASSRLDERLVLDIRGVPQIVRLIGDDRANPVLLILHGPGFGYAPLAPLFAPWMAGFTLAFWDQPGAGETQSVAPMALTLDRLARDGIAVAEALHARRPGVALVPFGVSGGTAPGLMMVGARPDLFAAYVGNGQVVHWARQAALSYAMILDRARAAGDAAAIAEIEAVGPPPWPGLAGDLVRGKYANAPTAREREVLADPAVQALFAGLPADTRERATAAFTALKPGLEAFDARALGPDFAIPMVFLQGAEDAHLVSSEVEAWAAELHAPSVAYVPIPGAGHMSTFLVDDMAALLAGQVRPLCGPR